MSGDGKVLISESLLQDGTFGVYIVPKDNLKVEYLLVGSLPSIEEAKAKVREAAAGFRHEGITDIGNIELRPRQRPQLAADVQLMAEKDLKDSIQSHIDSSLSGLSKSRLLKSVLSYGNLIFLFCCIAAWLFWTKHSFTVPKVDLPIVGNRLSGVSIKAAVLARYFPLALGVLFAASFLRVVRTNLGYDLLRKHILALVFQHGWRTLDFAKLVRNTMTKRGLGWMVNAIDELRDLDPASLVNLRKLGNASELRSELVQVREVNKTKEEESPTTDVRIELNRKLKVWLGSDFERRVHSLYFLDREKDYSPFVMCFDPFTYLVSLNRVTFRVYNFLVEHGVRVDRYNAPTDPYLVQRFAAPAFWLGVCVQVCFFGGLMVWSFFVAPKPTSALLTANVVATVLVLVIPNWWNYLAVIKSRGFPRPEPLGAYTVGPLTANHLSLVGY